MQKNHLANEKMKKREFLEKWIIVYQNRNKIWN